MSACYSVRATPEHFVSDFDVRARTEDSVSESYLVSTISWRVFYFVGMCWITIDIFNLIKGLNWLPVNNLKVSLVPPAPFAVAGFLVARFGGLAIF